MGGHSTATVPVEKYSNRSQSGNMNEPLAQVENCLSMPTTHARRHKAAPSQEFMEENGLDRAIHPRYSLDFAPSDFYLFSHVKPCLRGQTFETADEAVLAIGAVLRGSENGPCMRLFSIGCRDSGNALKPMVMILRAFNKIERGEPVSHS
jgi:hypothetical protein